MKADVSSMWRIQRLIWAGIAGLTLGCASAQQVTKKPSIQAPQSAVVDDQCRLAPVAGDTRMVATIDGRVILIGRGLGVMQSTDGAFSFSSIATAPNIRWPAITANDDGGVWASWIEQGQRPRAVVAPVELALGEPVVALVSSKRLIDTELVALGEGELLLFVTEVDGPPNSNEATYTIVCLASEDGGLSWEKRSAAVTGPWGLNIEDTRAFVRADGTVLLAFELEEIEGGTSEILVQRSENGGRSWSSATVLWGGFVQADREPGGFVGVGSDLWFVASTDVENPGTSYSGAEISMIRSTDGGGTWSEPRALIRKPDQISMGAIVIDGAVVLPSIRRYTVPRERYLALFRVDPVGRWPVTCGRPGMFSAGFEAGNLGNWE